MTQNGKVGKRSWEPAAGVTHFGLVHGLHLAFARNAVLHRKSLISREKI